MICANCGTENQAGRRFCDSCGAALAIHCASCGASNRPEARFCGDCGTALEPGSGASAGATAGAAIAPQAAPVAERRLITVLFADLVGFTPFAEERDPEEVRETLSRYFEIARDVVDRYGGTVEKFIGDAVMAVWGTPVAHEDDAERAVRAALDLSEAVRSLGRGIEARAGVLTGDAAVTLGATDQGMVAGDLVNTAARLQAVAPPSGVLVGEATMRAASAAIAFEPAGEHTLKGKAAPVPAWQALRVVAQRGGAGRSGFVEPPFVGRDEEFHVLKEQLLAGARDPRTRLASVTGPAGIGKSRLAWELEKYADGVVETIYWHRGRCPAYGDGVAFWALGEMVRSRARLAEDDDEQTTRAGIEAMLEQYVAEPDDRRWIEPALLALLGVEPTPPGGREMLFAAWRRLFEHIAALGTTVLVFEDLHWADEGLLDFIDHLLAWSKSVPIVILTLARPELFDRRPDWGAARRNFTALALDPLPSSAMEQILTGLVPGLPAEAQRAIIARSEGIPLYAVEMVRMLVAEGRLEAVDGGYRPAGDLGTLSVPESLRSLIASRLDALDLADRSLLQDASVLGVSFTLASLSSVSGIMAPDLEPRLRALVRRELLTVEADPRSPERGQYAFVQSLIREVAYGTLAKRDRRSRHLAAARYFEALGDEETAGVLASHYLAAHEASAEGAEAEAVAAQARLALRGAAERASALGGHAQALTYLGQARLVTADPAEIALLLASIVREGIAASRYDTAEKAAREAITIATQGDDRTAAAEALGSLGQVLIAEQRIPEAVTAMTDALAALPADADERMRASLLSDLSRAYYRNKEPARSIETADQALVLAERLGLRSVIASALVSKGTAMQMASRVQEAIALLRGGLALALEEGDHGTALRTYNNLSNSLGEEDVLESYEISRAGLELALKVGDLGFASWLLVNSAGRRYFLGQDERAIIADLDEFLERDLSPADRGYILEARTIHGVEMGEDVGAMVAEVKALAALEEDPQGAWTEGLRGMLEAVIRGDYAAAARVGIGLAEMRPDIQMADTAAMYARWAGDTALAREAVVVAERKMTATRESTGWAAVRRATVAILEGRDEQVLPAYRDALRVFEAMHSNLSTAMVGLDMLFMLGPDNPEARAAGERALAHFQGMGSRPWIERIASALAGNADAARPAVRAPGSREGAVVG